MFSPYFAEHHHIYIIDSVWIHFHLSLDRYKLKHTVFQGCQERRTKSKKDGCMQYDDREE